MNAFPGLDRARRWTLSFALSFFCSVGIAQAVDKVLILDSTVSGGAGSLEGTAAIALGYTVDVVNATQWAAMTTADFQKYRAIILGDPSCGSISAISAAEANAGTWGKAVNGNVIVIGTDPVFHAAKRPGAGLLTKKGIAFATAQAGKTGAYITLSCYYGGAAAGTPVPLLDKAFGSGTGSFQVRGQGLDDAHITASHPALTTPPPLTDADLQNWDQSVHEAFGVWPLNFIVLAIIRNSGTSYTAPDGSVGSPYILVRGEGVSVLSNIKLTPESAVNEVGTNHTFTATVTNSTGAPLPGVTITFKILTGPNVGLTATAVTDAGGKATFSYTSSKTGTDTVQAQFVDAAGKTQTANLATKQWIETVRPCMRTFSSTVLCETDSAGKPTGNYTWQFRFQNLSGKAVSHLFIVGLPAGVSVNQDHFVFTPPVTTLSPFINVTIKGAKPGPLSLKLSLHDQTLEECCSLTVSLDLKPCDCAQMVSETRPSCFHPFPPPFPYSFNLQNLSPIKAEYILVAAVSPADHLTPIPTSQLTVTQDVLAIPPLASGQKTGTKTLFLSGPGAAYGKDVCLLFGVHDQSLADCCSILSCFTLPDCAIRWTDFKPLGNADFVLLGTGFRIDNIGSSGKDGVGIALPGAESVALSWLPLDSAGPLPNGAFFEVSATGSSHQAETAGRLRVTKAGDSRYEIAPDIGGSATYQAQVFKGSQTVGTVRQQNGINIIVIWPVAASAEVVRSGDSAIGTLGFTLTTDLAVPWTFPSGQTLTGDRILITPDTSPVAVEGLDRFELRAADIPSITVQAASITFDCNENGIPDDEEIAAGTLADLDNDGIADECQASSGDDLDLNLNTGFDSSAGTLLPPGSSDADWRITNAGTPGPSKVVIHPAPAWPTLASSQWISLEANRGRSVPGLSTLRFESCFCIGDKASAAQLDLQLRADDSARVFLNGSPIGGPGGSFQSASPLAVHLTGPVGGSGPFKSGQNCLRVEVDDSGRVVTGLDLSGTVHAAHGVCASTSH